MKKKNLGARLSLGKINVSNLANVKGGNYPPFESEDICDTGTGGSGGSGGTGGYSYGCSNACSNACPSNNCYTDNHPASDPIHCRGCVVGDWF